VLAVLVSGCAANAAKQDMATNLSHVHMGHVSSSWGDTPGQAGLLPTAMLEAKVARKHAGAAAKKLDDLGWMKMHAKHVMHAVDPTVVTTGPGNGYGVIKAANGAAKHINAAASSEGASANVKTHALHVATSANNVAAWGAEVMMLANRVEAASSAAEAAPLVQQIYALTQQMVDGLDANGDGSVSWVKGEGGLMQAEKHLNIMAKGEGMQG